MECAILPHLNTNVLLFDSTMPSVNRALDSIFATTLSFPEMCSTSELSDLMYETHYSIAKSGIVQHRIIPSIGRQSISITTSAPIK